MLSERISKKTGEAKTWNKLPTSTSFEFGDVKVLAHFDLLLFFWAMTVLFVPWGDCPQQGG